MIHPDTELNLVSENIGYGIFATRLIPKGTIVWVLDVLDFVLTPEVIASLSPLQIQHIERYAYVDGQGRYILCWDYGKYGNHSCRPTTVPVGSICDIAARDILPGEELTWDYATCNIRESLSCQCGMEGCRGIVRSTDFASLVESIDREVAELVPLINTVPQPLLGFMIDEDFRRLQSIISGDVPIPSCSENANDNYATLDSVDSECNGRGGLWKTSLKTTPGAG